MRKMLIGAALAAATAGTLLGGATAQAAPAPATGVAVSHASTQSSPVLRFTYDTLYVCSVDCGFRKQSEYQADFYTRLNRVVFTRKSQFNQDCTYSNVRKSRYTTPYQTQFLYKADFRCTIGA